MPLRICVGFQSSVVGSMTKALRWDLLLFASITTLTICLKHLLRCYLVRDCPFAQWLLSKISWSRIPKESSRKYHNHPPSTELKRDQCTPDERDEAWGVEEDLPDIDEVEIPECEKFEICSSLVKCLVSHFLKKQLLRKQKVIGCLEERSNL